MESLEKFLACEPQFGFECISLHKRLATTSSKPHQNRDNLLISSSTPEFTKTAISCFNGRCIKHLPLPLSRNRRARANKRLCKYLHFVPTHPSPLSSSLHTHYIHTSSISRWHNLNLVHLGCALLTLFCNLPPPPPSSLHCLPWWGG